MGRLIVGAILVALVGCRAPVPGLGFLFGTPAPGAGGTTSGDDPVADAAAVPGAPIIEALDPENGGPGTEVVIRGRELMKPGTVVRFGDREIPATPVEDGALRIVIPDGATNEFIRVQRGEAGSRKLFRVATRLVLTVGKALPAAVGLPVPLGVQAFDSAGEAIPSPAHTLSVDPPDAADVISRNAVVPRKPVVFSVQATIGATKEIVKVAACTGDFFLEHYVGDGHAFQFVNRTAELMHGGTLGKEEGAADTAHLRNPWGLINNITIGTKKGLLIADSGSGRLRFVPDGGGSIETVVGGGSQVPIATDSAGTIDYDPKLIELVEPTGLALGKDIDDTATGSTRDVVIISERGRHRILAWYFNKPSPNVRVIAGTMLPTFTRQTATDSALVLSQAMGDQDVPKKVCGEATAATFWDPAGVAIVLREIKNGGTNLGNVAEIFVADTNNHVVRRIVRKPPPEIAKDFTAAGCNQANLPAKTGIITTVVGNGKAGDVITVSEATGSSINAPLDVALDQTGGKNSVIYVADSNNNRILQVDGAMNVAGETSTRSFRIDVVAPPAGDELAPLSHPSGILLLPGTNELFIADTLKNRVLLVPKNRSILVEIGSCSLEASPSNGLVWPHSLALEAIQGADRNAKVKLFMSDWQSHEVRRVKNTTN